MLSVVTLKVTNNPFMLSVVMLNVVMLNVANNPFMLSHYCECRYAECRDAIF